MMAEFPSKRAAAGTATGLKIVGKQTFARACEHNNTVDQQRVYVPPPNPSSPLFASLLFSMHPLRGSTQHTHRDIYPRAYSIALSLHSFLCQTNFGFVCHWVINICRDGIYTAYVNSINRHQFKCSIFHSRWIARTKKNAARKGKKKKIIKSIIN